MKIVEFFVFLSSVYIHGYSFHVREKECGRGHLALRFTSSDPRVPRRAERWNRAPRITHEAKTSRR